MLKNLLLGLILFCSSLLQAQLVDGSIAPDFTGLDLEGNTINLYDILAEGKTVVLDIGATWCQPCWLYHQSGQLEDFMDMYGPDGTDEARVLFIEGDVKTGLEDLQGTGTNTLGNWLEGTTYPIMPMGGIPDLYEVFGLPFTYLICPDRTIKLVQQIPAEDLAEEMGLCAAVDGIPEPDFNSVLSTGCGQLEVQFEDSSWPRGESYLWDFGDGAMSTEREPTHLYTAPGEYEVTLTVSNAVGSKTLARSMEVVIGEGHSASNLAAGKVDTVGSGRMFDRGIQGLLFDAHQDLILESATVYSDRDDWRTFVVTDSNEVLVARRDIRIPIGEYRIRLDMYIPAGFNYRIGMWSDAWLFRNNGGTAYPYVVEDLVSITSSTVPSDPTGFYYYLYDWKVREVECADVPSAIYDEDGIGLIMHPNPATQTVTLESSDPSLHKAVVYNSAGQVVMVEKTYNLRSLQLDIEQLEPGLYHVKVGQHNLKFVKI